MTKNRILDIVLSGLVAAAVLSVFAPAATVFVQDEETVTEFLTVYRDGDVDGTFTVGAPAPLATIEPNGDVDTDGALNVDGTSTLGGSTSRMQVDGDGNADIDGALNVDGAVTFAEWRDAGALLPFREDADPATPGLQCPAGMSRVTEMEGLYLIGVTGDGSGSGSGNGTLDGDQASPYADSDVFRRGGTAHAGPTVTVSTGGGHQHTIRGRSTNILTGGGPRFGTNGSYVELYTLSSSGGGTPEDEGEHSHAAVVSGGNGIDQPPPAPAKQVIWCEFL